MPLQMHTERVTGTGSAINVDCGFSPKFVLIVNETDPGMFVWFDDMDDAEMGKLTNTVALTFATANGVSAYAGAIAATPAGFTIGADSDMNAASDVLHVMALG